MTHTSFFTVKSDIKNLLIEAIISDITERISNGLIKDINTEKTTDKES